MIKMKQVTILFCMMLFAFVSMNAQAQIKIPKAASDLTKSQDIKLPTDALSKELIKALNPGKGFDISPDKLLKLDNNNKSFVNDLMGIFGGSGTDAEKHTLAEGKQKERKNFITNLLGEGKAAKYYNIIKPQVEPLIKKYALAKFLM